MRAESKVERTREMRGGTSVELALALPLFMLLCAGLVDGGRAVWSRTTLSHATAEAVRWASVRSSESNQPASAHDVAARVRSQAVALDPDMVTVATAWTPSNAPGGTVTVTVDYQYEPALGFLPFGPIRLSVTGSQTIAY